jgi:riboflavin synthase
VSAETVERTTLGRLTQGAKVNLERALRLSDRLGGHLVSGHIDGVGRLELRQAAGKFTVYQFQAPPNVMEYVVEKGSIAVDGISLTIAKVGPQGFTTAVIPQTESVTTLKDKAIGDPVNVEADMLGKYVKRFVGAYLGHDDTPAGQPRRGLADLLKDFTDSGR